MLRSFTRAIIQVLEATLYWLFSLCDTDTIFETTWKYLLTVFLALLLLSTYLYKIHFIILTDRPALEPILDIRRSGNTSRCYCLRLKNLISKWCIGLLSTIIWRWDVWINNRRKRKTDESANVSIYVLVSFIQSQKSKLPCATEELPLVATFMLTSAD